MRLYFCYTMVQKVKNDQKLKSRGPALNAAPFEKSIIGHFRALCAFLQTGTAERLMKT